MLPFVCRQRSYFGGFSHISLRGDLPSKAKFSGYIGCITVAYGKIARRVLVVDDSWASGGKVLPELKDRFSKDWQRQRCCL